MDILFFIAGFALGFVVGMLLFIDGSNCEYYEDSDDLEDD